MTSQITNMKISTDFPPNYRDIVDALGDSPSAVYCYGNVIYNPNGREITPDIEIHEQVHANQQGSNPYLSLSSITV